jgi:hypothetical protein
MGVGHGSQRYEPPAPLELYRRREPRVDQVCEPRDECDRRMNFEAMEQRVLDLEWDGSPYALIVESVRVKVRILDARNNAAQHVEAM